MKGDLSHLITGQFDVFGFDVELSTSKQKEIDINICRHLSNKKLICDGI